MKQTLYFGNPCYLSKLNAQLIVKLAKSNEKTIDKISDIIASIPIEDIGIVILDHNQITITHSLLSEFSNNNISLITCDDTHHPNGMILSIDGNHIQSARFKTQISASEKFKKSLWQQVIKKKIINQSVLLKNKGIDIDNMYYWMRNVRSGDPDNYEARAAIYYWKNIFHEKHKFKRDRFGFYPNNLLNYGYSILRATVARNIVSCGLLPTLGIQHRNKYNAFCLADDIMEPYRPFVDHIVTEIIEHDNNSMELSIDNKKQLLEISSYKVVMESQTSSVMNSIHQTCSSLVQCYAGEKKRIVFPDFL